MACTSKCGWAITQWEWLMVGNYLAMWQCFGQSRLLEIFGRMHWNFKAFDVIFIILANIELHSFYFLWLFNLVFHVVAFILKRSPHLGTYYSLLGHIIEYADNIAKRGFQGWHTWIINFQAHRVGKQCASLFLVK